MDESSNKLVSTRFQPNDDFTRYFFERQVDGTFRIRVKATNTYINEAADKLISTRTQVNNDTSRFLLERAEALSAGPAISITKGIPSATWLSVSPTSGTTPADLIFTANPASLVQGFYSATVEIRNTGALSVPPTQEAAVTLTSSVSRFYLPFDNTQGFVTSMAMINTNSAGATAVTATMRDEFGALIGTEVLALPARGHTAFALPTRFPILANRRGVVEFTATTPSITGLGLRFAPTGAFTSFPVQLR